LRAFCSYESYPRKPDIQSFLSELSS